MSYSERTQVLLSPRQRARLESIAQRTHRSVGAVIRDAIDAYEASNKEEREQAVATLVSLELPVEDWSDMKRDIVRRATKEARSE